MWVHSRHPRVDRDVAFLILRSCSSLIQTVLLSNVALCVESHVCLSAAGEHVLVLEEHVWSIIILCAARAEDHVVLWRVERCIYPILGHSGTVRRKMSDRVIGGGVQWDVGQNILTAGQMAGERRVREIRIHTLPVALSPTLPTSLIAVFSLPLSETSLPVSVNQPHLSPSSAAFPPLSASPRGRGLLWGFNIINFQSPVKTHKPECYSWGLARWETIWQRQLTILHQLRGRSAGETVAFSSELEHYC